MPLKETLDLRETKARSLPWLFRGEVGPQARSAATTRVDNCRAMDATFFRPRRRSVERALGEGPLFVVLRAPALPGMARAGVFREVWRRRLTEYDALVNARAKIPMQQRQREIGIQIAMGALPSGVARMFVASGVRVSVIALAIGLPLSLIGFRALMSMGVLIVPEFEPWLVGVGIALVLLAVATAATWVPARQAARVDPARTLRVE